ncbi:MAG: PaaI family thioesterase [Dehalococcoidia bacterium]
MTDEHAHHTGAWQPNAVLPEGKRLALRRLADATRQTIDLLMETDAPDADLLAAAAAAEAFNARLAAAPRGRPLWGFAEASTSGDPVSFYDNSPISGPANPIAPPLTMRMVGGEVEAWAEFGIAYEGPPGHVHGGWVAAAFDEVLGMVQSGTGNPGMTGTLTVRYRRPTPLLRRVTFRGRLDRVEGRKIFTVATLSDGDTLCAEAEGIFISVGQERFRALAEQADRGAVFPAGS